MALGREGGGGGGGGEGGGGGGGEEGRRPERERREVLAADYMAIVLNFFNPHPPISVGLS